MAVFSIIMNKDNKTIQKPDRHTQLKGTKHTVTTAIEKQQGKTRPIDPPKQTQNQYATQLKALEQATIVRITPPPQQQQFTHDAPSETMEQETDPPPGI
mmetsp:Transcript_27119/g.59841  ORF Transcript_27119/g.59841 Transcript_27119/m.59841 type:complete len:99 (+) Transcript_27119:3-299(+)